MVGMGRQMMRCGEVFCVDAFASFSCSPHVVCFVTMGGNIHTTSAHVLCSNSTAHLLESEVCCQQDCRSSTALTSWSLGCVVNRIAENQALDSLIISSQAAQLSTTAAVTGRGQVDGCATVANTAITSCLWLPMSFLCTVKSTKYAGLTSCP